MHFNEQHLELCWRMFKNAKEPEVLNEIFNNKNMRTSFGLKDWIDFRDKGNLEKLYEAIEAAPLDASIGDEEVVIPEVGIEAIGFLIAGMNPANCPAEDEVD